MQCFSVALVIVVAFQSAVADLPVHCVRHQIAGDWEFTLGPLGPKRSSCGHAKPDNPYMQPHMKFLEKMGPLTTRKMTLNQPSTVAAEDGSSGTWTMIYDEGFEVALGSEVFFAFSKFSFTDADRKFNVSHCGETQIGWYRDTSRNHWGCYVGKKAGVVPADVAPAPPKPEAKAMASDDEAAPSAPEAKVSQGPKLALTSFGSEDTAVPEEATVDELEAAAVPTPVALPQTEPEAAAVSTPVALPQTEAVDKNSMLNSWLDSADPMALKPDEAAPADVDAQQKEEDTDDLFSTPPEYKPWVPSSAGFDKPMEGNWQQSVAKALNFLQLGWTAHAYQRFTGKSPHQLNRYAGVRHTHGRIHAHGRDTKESFTSFLGMGRKVRHASFEDKDFDWRKKNGKNWLTPVVSQGDCGSCYTIATVHMLTARNRIRAGSTSEPSFSASFPLYCSEYNQGCDGGYGFLQTKWSEDVGLVPESCLPFSEGGGSCEVTSQCNLGNKRYRATKHHYVGGYYGGSDADSIKQELLAGGPLVMSFEPKEDFMYYKSGVYRSVPEKIHQEWEQVDHAVLLVGYGVEKLKSEKKSHKYWTMQNSWGTDWGEDGYFRMERGNDESGCESIVVAAEVLQESSNPTLDDFIKAL
jgi:cathepsin C